MRREEFRNIWKKGIVILDGATGTNLMAAGMPSGACTETWILEHPEILTELQRDFVKAGTDILCAPTFAGNRLKLADHGMEGDLRRINTELVRLSRRAAEGRALVAADMTMTGRQLYPVGKLSFEEAVEVYREQANVICEAGADLFFIETMMSLQETRAAVIGIRETCDLPIMASLTFEENGRTVFGTSAEAAVTVLQSLGADAVGMNCSTGPEGMLNNLGRMAQYACVPLIAKPNAGLPELVDGRAVYPASPEDFAAGARKLVKAGARFVGGCCGTTPDHIRALAEAVKELEPEEVKEESRHVFATERDVFTELSEETAFLRVDGSEGVEKSAMRAAKAGKKPLLLDTDDPETVRAVLRHYPGVPVKNRQETHR